MSSINTSDIIYLVDLENIGTTILSEYIVQYPDAKYIVFYSDATVTPCSILDQAPVQTAIKFVNCKTGGNNAMDFCISAMAGRLTAVKGQVVKIMSNDKGYDPMLHMLQEYGVRIKREAVTYPSIVKASDQLEESGQQNQNLIMNEALITTIKNIVPKKYQADVLRVIPGAANRKAAHELLQTILPQSLVQEIYRKLRKYIPKEVE